MPRTLHREPERGNRYGTADHGSEVCESLVEHFLVDPRRLAGRLLVIAPRSAENPIVQPLAPGPKTATGSVIRTGDVSVE